VVLEKSVKQIRRENGWGVNTIKRWLRKFNIEIRQIEEIQRRLADIIKRVQAGIDRIDKFLKREKEKN